MGQFFGEGCLNDQPVRTASTSAMTDCRITSITKSVMLTAIHEQPKFSNLFMDHLLSRNSRIQADVVDQLFNSSEKRLARLLLLLANYGKEGSPPIAPVTVSQETLAAMIGTTRSRVSHFMNKFRKSGFIKYRGKIEVHQSLLNSLLHDKPQIREDEPAQLSKPSTAPRSRTSNTATKISAEKPQSSRTELQAVSAPFYL